MNSKKISQQELRQLMRERQKSRQTSSRPQVSPNEADSKIDSPLARYDTDGRLSCIVCNESVASNHLWSLHIVSKSHKNKIEEIKRKKLSQKPSDVSAKQKTSSKPEQIKHTVKRKLESNDNTISEKIAKSVDIKIQGVSTDVMDVDDNITNADIIESGLPKDFFDNSNQLGEATKQVAEEKGPDYDSHDNHGNDQTDSSCLPKGFFDDPIKDAKARKVIYKNPMDEQWDEFQKVIAEENHKSENIIEEDVEELQVERNIEEIEEQIANWIKVNEMQKRAEIMQKHMVKSEDKMEDSDSDLDEQDFVTFSNWRSRTALNPK